MRFSLLLLCYFACAGIVSCKTYKKTDHIPAFTTPTTVNCIVEIPAGTNKKIEFNKTTKRFEIDTIDGDIRVKNYLPYPANYGFIPATFSDKTKGGDGDPIDVLLLCESVPTGTIIEAIPIAMLRLVDSGEMDDKVICIPKDPALQTLKATDITDFNKSYPKVLQIIQLWFQHNDSSEAITIKGWVGKEETVAEIKRLSRFYRDANLRE